MTVALDRALPAADAGVMADGKADPDPEVPERARRRTFTAKYKLEVLAAYDAAGPGEEGRDLAPGGLVLQPCRGVAAGPRCRCAGRPGPADRYPRRVRRCSRAAGQLVPAAPGQPRAAAPGTCPAR